MSAELPILGIILAAIQFGDAVECAIPIGYLRREFDRLELAPSTRNAMPVVKTAAGGGLVAGLWLPLLGVVTAVALVAYFLLAIAVHVRASDPPARYISATGMLAVTVVVLVVSYLPAL